MNTGHRWIERVSDGARWYTDVPLPANCIEVARPVPSADDRCAQCGRYVPLVAYGCCAACITDVERTH